MIAGQEHLRLPPERDDADWRRVREHDLEELWEPARAPHVAAAYANRMTRLVEVVRAHHAVGARVLDVGCAQGTLGLLLAAQGYRVTLLDVRAGHLDYARARHTQGEVDFVVGELAPTVPPRNDFDCVICTEVIEHTSTPARLLQALASKGRPGGSLLLTTPNADYRLAHLPSFGTAPQSTIDDAEQNSADGDAHRFLYTREELISLVRSVGLGVVQHAFFQPFWIEGHLRTRYAHRAALRMTGEPLPLKRLAAEVPQGWQRWISSSQLLLAEVR